MSRQLVGGVGAWGGMGTGVGALVALWAVHVSHVQ